MADDVLILIPARMASTRLPGKPLADIAGQPMIVHVLRRAEAAGIGAVAVATDSGAVFAAVEKAGGRAVMTRADHASGSDRIFEALERLDPQGRAKIVVNVQGDLPTLEPGDLRIALKPLDDPTVVRPQVQVWSASAVPWSRIADELPAHEKGVRRRGT